MSARAGLLRAAWQLTVKDLRLYVRDRTGLALGFLLPLGLVGVFGMIMGHVGGGGGMTARVELAVADEAGDEASAALRKWGYEGRINARQTVFEGIESCVDALNGLFTGANIGKMLVKLSEPTG